MNRILFLDVDGPLIPSTMFFTHQNASNDRNYSPQCLAIVNKICKESGCKVVMNTTHNAYPENLVTSMIDQGFLKEYFHEEPHTQFPFVSGMKFSGVMPDPDNHPRMEAIRQWMKKHGQVDWAALDDVKFTENERLTLVDYDVGLTVKEYNDIGDLWNMNFFFTY